MLKNVHTMLMCSKQTAVVISHNSPKPLSWHVFFGLKSEHGVSLDFRAF